MNQFAKWRYDRTLLFHSYCDLIGVTEKSFTLWKDVKFGKGVPVIGGVAVDEMLLEKYDCKPRIITLYAKMWMRENMFLGDKK